MVPVPITFFVAPARETTALRAALDDVPDAVDVAPRFTVVRPVVALRADTAGVAALRVDVALRAAVALRADVATDRVDNAVATLASHIVNSTIKIIPNKFFILVRIVCQYMFQRRLPTLYKNVCHPWGLNNFAYAYICDIPMYPNRT